MNKNANNILKWGMLAGAAYSLYTIFQTAAKPASGTAGLGYIPPWYHHIIASGGNGQGIVPWHPIDESGGGGSIPWHPVRGWNWKQRTRYGQYNGYPDAPADTYPAWWPQGGYGGYGGGGYGSPYRDPLYQEEPGSLAARNSALDAMEAGN